MIAVALVISYLLTNVLIFVLCHEEVLVVCKRILQQICPYSLYIMSSFCKFY